MTASKDGERKPGLADAAGRAAFYPARAAARAWRGPIEEAVDEVLSAPEIARVIDRALAGSLPEELARSLVRHRVFERIAAELAASGELERLVAEALRSPQTLELTDKVLASDEMQSAVRHVASSPELRDAIARQTTGLADEMVGGLRASAARLDDRAEQVLRRPPRSERSPYAGIATRAIALATDGLLTVVLFMSIVGIASLVASLVGGLRPEWLVGVLLGSGWMLVVGVYFVLFWSTAGQTPGMRLLNVRVRGPGGETPSIGRSLLRLVGLVLAIVPLFAGFLPVLFTDRRRGLPDFLAGTVVVYDYRRDNDETSLADAFQERENALLHQRCGHLVVVTEAAVRKKVPLTRVEVELRALHLVDQLARSGGILFEPLVAIHRVDLDGDAVGPAPELGRREARVEEQRALRAGTRLGELLGRHDPEGEAGVDELRRESFGGADAALEQRSESDLLRVGDPIVQLRKGVPVVHVRRMDHVTCVPQLGDERAEPFRLPLCVMEQQDLGHPVTLPRRSCWVDMANTWCEGATR